MQCFGKGGELMRKSPDGEARISGMMAQLFFLKEKYAKGVAVVLKEIRKGPMVEIANLFGNGESKSIAVRVV